jgi:hypothetical protein
MLTIKFNLISKNWHESLPPPGEMKQHLGQSNANWVKQQCANHCREYILQIDTAEKTKDR